MHTHRKSASALLTLAALTCTTSALAQTRPPASNGADVIVGDVNGPTNNTPNATTDVGFDSFAIGTTSCNKGNTELLWYSGTNQHPVIGQNLFRLYNGRFEQIGQAWLKHGFTALQGNVCNSDLNFPHATCSTSPSGGARLGVGCSDPYSSGLNNGQSGLGPKWQVNAAKGVFPYPFASPAFSGEVARRLRVRVTDLNPTAFPGARYFAEGQYVVPDDAGYGNGTNSASYREATIAQVGTSTTDFNMALISSTVREKPAIYAWQAVDASVQIATADIINDGRFILACKVSGPVSGVYTYEYALHNLNSDRCAGSFSVPFPAGASITSVGFKDVDYYDGELNQTPANPASDDWSSSVGATAVTWSGPAYAGTPASYTITGANTTDFTQSFRLTSWTQGTGNDHTANVLRWGTLFNFRFQSTTAPAAGRIGVGLWRPGTLTNFTMNIQTPGGASFGTASTGPCCNGTTCTVTTQAACAGVFGQVGATCTPNPCTGAPTGSCCSIAGACTVTIQTGCTGTWTQGGVCTPNPCAQPGACCDSNGLCTSVIQGACTGTFTAGGVCSPNPCPQPTGACCSAAGACTVATPSTCTGTYLGNGTGCTANACSNNDLCTAAQPLCAGVTANGTTATATTNTTVSCTTSNREVWFSYTPATTGSVSIAVNAATGTTMTDSVLAVWSACTGGTELACDDDSGPGLFSLISAVNLNAGVTYFISVGTFGSTASGTFTITVTGGGGQGCNPPTGTCCVGSTCTSTTQAACTGTWTQGGTCGASTCVVNGSCCGFDASCTVTAQSGCTGTWTSGGSCSPNLCPPGNDNCNNRAGIGLGSLNYSTLNATTDGIAHNPGCLFFNNDNITNDIWYNYPSSFTGSLRIDTCGSSYDTKIAVYDGSGCTNFATRLLACDDDNPTVCGTGSTQSAVTINVVAGQNYTIRIGGYNGASGAGIVTLTATPTATGACCAAAGTCTVTTSTGCTGATYQGDNTVCSPNPCPQPTGACCVGTTCTIVAQAACTGSWRGAGVTCGATGNPTACCRANFNGANGVTVQDIFDFMAAWFAGSPSADINGVSGVTVQDIFDFLALWFAGCPG